ncbi:MAG TPA: hypothetical protein VK273_04500 [Gaiellaceae bacterium]|nr:hypothetical protein [Gaiellaceae bacterium]
MRETDLFEHLFQADVRNRKGRVVGTRPVTAGGGHWHRTVRYEWSTRNLAPSRSWTSPSRTSLSCIAQIRVPLAPAP